MKRHLQHLGSNYISGIIQYPAFHNCLRNIRMYLPHGPALKNPPASGGDRGLVPGLGRHHMPWSSACAPPLQKSMHSRACAPQQEKPPSETPVHLQQEWPLLTTIWESLHSAMKTQCSQKQIIKKIFGEWFHEYERWGKHTNPFSASSWTEVNPCAGCMLNSVCCVTLGNPLNPLAFGFLVIQMKSIKHLPHRTIVMRYYSQNT